jgi:hypothetical protein
MMGEPLY